MTNEFQLSIEGQHIRAKFKGWSLLFGSPIESLDLRTKESVWKTFGYVCEVEGNPDTNALKVIYSLCALHHEKLVHGNVANVRELGNDYHKQLTRSMGYKYGDAK